MLTCHMGAALCAVARMAPRAKQPGTVGVEKDHEVLTLLVDLESEIRSPLSGHPSRPGLEPLQGPSESHPLRVEEPGAVTRLEDDRVHEDNRGA